MSKTIDQRVVEMRFDNANFEKNVHTSMSTLDKLKKSLKFEDSAKGFENVSKAAGRVDMGGLANGVESVRMKFSALEVMAVTALSNITNSAVNAGKKLVSELTLDPIISGFQEYETQINATQTILANTQKEGATIQDVNRALDELNKYADLTIYNFTEMTRNIGTFTAAGVDLNTSVNAIKGIANLAAVSGSTSQQASTAMYQLSQALASGTVKLMDWNSVVNAGMGGQVFQDALKMTARVHGIAIDEMIADEGSFRETLSKGWITSDIMTETLQHFTAFTDTYNEESLKRQGYNEKEIAEIKQLGITATDAATKVKTLSQLYDVMKETAQSGWAATWKILLGDFEEAKESLTKFSNMLNEPLAAAADARNKILSEGFSSGWKQFLNEGIEDAEGFKEAVLSIGKEAVPGLEDLIEKAGGFEESLKKGWITSDMLAEAVGNLTAKTAGLSDEELRNLGYTRDQVTALEDLNNRIQDGSINLDDYAKKIGRISGRENIILALTAAFEKLQPILGTIKDAFNEVFEPLTGEKLYNFTVQIKDFVSGLTISEEALNNFKMSIEGILSIFHIAGKGISAFAQIIGHLLGKLLPVGDGILDVTGSLGEFLVSIDKAIDSGGYLEKFVEVVNGAIDKLASGFKIAKDYVLNFIGSWTGIDFTKFESLRDVFALVGEKLSEFGEKIRDTFPWVNSLQETVTAAFQKIRGSADEDLGAVNTVLESLKTAGSKVKEVFSNIAQKIGAFLAPVVAKIKSAFSGVTITDVIGTGLLAGIFGSIKKFADALADLLKNFKGIGESISGVLDAARDAIVLWQKDIKANILLKIAGAVGILAAALWVISKVDVTRVKGSMVAITILLAEVSSIMAGIMKWGTSANALEGLSEAAQLGKIATAMMVIAGAVLILAAALKKCENLNWENTLPAMTALFVLMGEMVVAMGAFMKLVQKNPIDKEQHDLVRYAKSMIGMSVALLIIAEAVALLGNMDRGKLVQGGVAIAVLTGVLGGVTAMLKAIKDVKITEKGLSAGSMEGVAKSFIAMAVALTMLYVPIRLFSSLDADKFESGSIRVGIALAALTASLSVMKAIKGDMSGVAGTFLAMTTALTLLIIPIKILGGMDIDALGNGLIGIIVPLAVMAVVLSKVADADYSTVGANMIGMATAMVLLAVPIKILGSMDLGSLAKGIVGFGVALGILVGTAYLLAPLATSLSSLSKAMLAFGAACLGVGVLIGAIAFALITLATIGAAGVAAILAALTGLIQGFNLMMPIIGEALTSLILTICKVLKDTAPAITETALYLIDEFLQQIEDYVPSIVSHLTKIIQKIGQAMTEYFGEVGLGDWISTAIFAGLVAASALLVKGFAAVSKDVPKALIGAAGVAAILVIIGGVLVAMTLLDLDGVMDIAASLSTVLLSLSVTIGVLGLMPLTAGLAAGLVLAEFIAVMAAVMAALGGLNQIPGFSWLMDEGIKVLGQIGEGIGTFVGSIIGAGIEAVSEGIASSGANLSKFMTDLQPFIEGAKNIDSSVLAGVAALTGAILLLTAASFIEGVMSLFTLGAGSLTTLGADLASFGPEFKVFADSISGINVEAVTASAAAISAITGVIAAMNSDGLLGKVLDLFTGTNDLADFAAGLGDFGSALMTYGESVAGIDKYVDDVETSAVVATKIIEIAQLIPNSGGLLGLIVGNNDLDDFGESIKPFGKALVTYGQAVSGIGKYQKDIEKSEKAATKIIEIAQLIPNSGGLLGLIVGNNDLDDFGDKIALFGDDLMQYATAVQGIGSYTTDIEQSFTIASSIMSLVADAQGIKYGANLGKFADNLIDFAKDMNTFTTECAKMNSDSLDQLRTALTSIRDIAINFSSIDTTSLNQFIAAMDQIGSTSLDAFLASFTNAQSSVTSAISVLMTDLSNAVSSWDEKLKSKFKASGKAGLRGLTESRKSFKGEGASLMAEVGKGVESRSKTIEQKFASAAATCLTKLRNYYTQFQSAGAYLATGFANGITSTTPKVGAAASKVATKASTTLANKLEVASPSKVGYRIGNFFGMGFTNGIDANAECAARSGENLAESAQSNLTAAIAKILAILDGELDTTPTIRPVLDLSEIQNGAAAMSALMNSLSGTQVEGTVSVARRTANCMSRRPFADEKVVSETSGTHNESTTNNFYITGADPNAIADAVDRKLQFKAGRRKATWA